jgi:RNA polymerase sigma-70 factor (ECF subfamily)
VTDPAQSNWCEALYETKAAELLLYGRALGLTYGEAQDVLQETFMALLQRDQKPEKPEYYCIRTFRNRALNYRRSLWRRLTRELESKRWFEREPGESGPEREAMAALSRLPREQREVIVLKIWHEYTFEEVGDLLEVSPNTAAGRYRYGVQRLKKILNGASYERDQTSGDTVALLGAAPPCGEA